MSLDMGNPLYVAIVALAEVRATAAYSSPADWAERWRAAIYNLAQGALERIDELEGRAQ